MASAGSGRHEKQCDICQRSFARTEHLARHRRTHTKEKPFSCPYCPRAFQRSDVKAAHVKNCHAAPADVAAAQAATETSASKRARVACDNCRKLKTRCDGQEPCARCQSSGRTCRYSNIPPSAPSVASSSHSASIDNQSLVGSQRRGSDAFVSPIDHTPIPIALHYDTSPAAPVLPFQTAQALPYLQHPLTMPLAPGPLMPAGDLSLSTIDTSLMTDFWPMPMLNSQFWFEEPDLTFDPMALDVPAPLPAHELSYPMQALTSRMQEYFDRKARAASPATNKQGKMWYSAQPDMRNHSPEVIRVFLALFRKHVPKTFTIFQDSLHNPAKSRIFLTFAMAATGGLFCSVDGSSEVARALYNDARRLLLAHFNLRGDSFESGATHEDYLVMAKTFILLNLYGICSGDKRSYEFVEVFHANFIATISEYADACRRASWLERTQNHSARLLEALHILDCYRVIIMTRPPSFSSHYISQLALESSYQGELHQLHYQISKLTSGSRTTDPEISASFSLATLASLNTALWPAMYPSQNRYGAETIIFEGSCLGKPDFASLACDNWYRSQKHAVEPSVLAVFHMMNIMLHANITTLMHFAHVSLEEDPNARDPAYSLLAREVHEWVRDGNGKIARWHATNLITTVQGALTSPKLTKMELTGSSRQPSDSRRLPFEAPHVPYAVYYATLVLWCSAFCMQREPGQAQAQIMKGERILSSHQIHIAQTLAKVLNDIK